MRPEASFRVRSRTWPKSIRGGLRAGVPLLIAVAAFSCTAYAPAMDRDYDPPVAMPVTGVPQPTAANLPAQRDAGCADGAFRASGPV